MITEVDLQDQIQWEIFDQTNQNHDVVNVDDLYVSDTQLEVMLSYEIYRPYRYQDNGVWKYGYGTPGTYNHFEPLFEHDAYSAWIADVKKHERSFQKQLDRPMPQSVYDGLFSYFYTNGRWTSAQGPRNVTYDVRSAIQNQRWTTAANMISNSVVNPTRSREEAKTMQLGVYSTIIPRDVLRSKGIRRLRSNYLSGFSDRVAKKQAEVAYFAETGTFLPTMSQTRKREISNLARPFMN